jgi:hypothetical protein
MIGFFRRIRKKLADDNQFVKYSRYAVGEIILVMVGILLALQVNTWNQSRLKKNNERGLLNTLLKDLYLSEKESIEMISKDSISFDSFQFFLSGESARETLIGHLKIDSIFHPLIWASVNTEVPVINSYTDLKNAGQTGLISSESIRIRFTALENRFNRLNKILEDRFSVQLINIDKFVINELNFVQLLKYDRERFKVDYGIKNDYSTLFSNQFVLNSIGVKLDLTATVLDERGLLLAEIRELIKLIEKELKK